MMYNSILSYENSGGYDRRSTAFFGLVQLAIDIHNMSVVSTTHIPAGVGYYHCSY